MNKIHSEQLTLQTISTVYGPKDYHEFRSRLAHVNKIIEKTGIEDGLILDDLKKHKISEACTRTITKRRQMFRCCILKVLSGLDYRELAVRIADSELYRWFAGYNGLGIKRTPSKSTLERFYNHFDENQIRRIVDSLNKKVTADENAPELLDREEGLKSDTIFADTTCLKAPIHFPVDWVLLRDSVRSLTKAIICIRKQGLKHRMATPELFLSSINKLCMDMAHSRRKKNAKKRRKFILRKMKKITKKIQEHGERYRKLLTDNWNITSWSYPQARCVLQRIETILHKLPEATWQAHERIIGERTVASKKKMLSMYEENIHVIVRGKSGAEVEFGNGLYLAEQKDGLIVDWKLFKDHPPHDSTMVIPSVKRIRSNCGSFDFYCADRGFYCKKNENKLSKYGIASVICPRNPQELIKRQQSEKFKALQKRRGQTEGRVGIMKNVYLTNPLNCKGFKNRERTVSLSVLTHNLWLISGIAKEEAETREKEKFKKVA